MKRIVSEPAILKPLVVGGMMFALIGLLIDVHGTAAYRPRRSNHEACQGRVNDQVAISQQQLAQLLTIPERNTKARVREVLKDPYCQLPSLQIRAGVSAEREVYPLAFDSQTRLVILYEGDEYAGYRFSF